ncbi:MAG: alkaline phosphatase family protein [Candidatus Glassbacteria bacterium]
MSAASRRSLFILFLITLACSQQPHRRVVVLGFDGLSPQLLFPWTREGELPSFHQLMKTGSYGILNSTLPPSSAPAWTSCITGVGPGKHGIFSFIRLIGPVWEGASAPKLSFNSSMSNDAKTLWEIIGSVDRKSISINVPLTSPPCEINGIMIAGFPHPSKAPLTYPESLEKEIPEYRPDVYGVAVQPGKEDEFLTDVYDICEKRERAALEFFDEEDWDLFFAVFTLTDRIQHYFWKYMDSDHPLYTEDRGGVYHDEIKRAYQRADEILGRFISRLDDYTYLIVMSDHGFRPVRKQVNGNVFLKEVNSDSMFMLYPTNNFGSVFEVKPRLPLMKSQETDAMREDFIKRMIHQLETLEDPQTGARIINKTYTREELYSGPHLSEAPDIIAMENEGYLFLNLVKKQGLTLIQNPPDRSFFSGFHRREGVVFLKGNGVIEGNELDGNSILDIAPTVLALLDVTIEQDMEGSPLTEAFVEEMRGKMHTDERFSYDIATAERRYILGEEGYLDREVEKELKSIGYVR